MPWGNMQNALDPVKICCSTATEWSWKFVPTHNYPITVLAVLAVLVSNSRWHRKD